MQWISFDLINKKKNKDRELTGDLTRNGIHRRGSQKKNTRRDRSGAIIGYRRTRCIEGDRAFDGSIGDDPVRRRAQYRTPLFLHCFPMESSALRLLAFLVFLVEGGRALDRPIFCCLSRWDFDGWSMTIDGWADLGPNTLITTIFSR